MTDLDRYLAGHATGLDFAGVAAQVESPAVKKVVDALLGADAVPEAVYREALIKHRPALQDAYRRYFANGGSPQWCFRPPRYRRQKLVRTIRFCSTVRRCRRWQPHPQSRSR